MPDHRVVSREDWLSERTAFLVREKEFTRERDAVSQQRRELPWMKVTESYAFDGPKGRETLADLFDGRSQLLVYHFMFAPDASAGCRHCSFWADGFDPMIVHLNQRDVSMVAVSRAPYEKLAAYQKRMGWHFKWLSSGGSRFNYDFLASFTPEEVAAKQAYFNFRMQDPGVADREGLSVFLRDADGSIYLTYASFARGIDMTNAAYHYLDLLPKGRDEGDRGPFWVKRHDEYGR